LSIQIDVSGFVDSPASIQYANRHIESIRLHKTRLSVIDHNLCD